MDDSIGSFPEPKKIAVWAEGSRIEAKEFVIPKNTDSTDDIPTIPDLDELHDILEKEISKPPITSHTDTETANTLAEVSNEDTLGTDTVLEVLRAHVPKIKVDNGDSIWTVNSLLTQLADEEQNPAG
ncbi:hypothetical protein EVAR_80959_1 [Eumeta japonica]|uniref:Uncharacterized protein n=1 Tax=Eumeta variegata TaxID=151549 RepID=A0A4C1WRQ5_EUMVA|nr:hypothetical protein EVAR_80959_1 [Eumeta japonica]